MNNNSRIFLMKRNTNSFDKAETVKIHLTIERFI